MNKNNLIIIGVIAAAILAYMWYYKVGFWAPKTPVSAPIIENIEPTIAPIPMPPQSTGASAYAVAPATLYDIALQNVIRNVNPEEYVGEVTGTQGIYYIIDNIYLISTGLVRQQ